MQPKSFSTQNATSCLNLFTHERHPLIHVNTRRHFSTRTSHIYFLCLSDPKIRGGVSLVCLSNNTWYPCTPADTPLVHCPSTPGIFSPHVYMSRVFMSAYES